MAVVIVNKSTASTAGTITATAATVVIMYRLGQSEKDKINGKQKPNQHSEIR